MAKRPDWFVQSIGYAGPLEDCVIADGWLGVKTHDLPADDFPAIYVIRDGRAAIVSYYHMLRDFTEMKPSLEDIISGAVWPGSWSAHVDAWLTREKTLQLRYEDLVSNPEAQCKKIAAFLAVEQIAPFSQSFEKLQQHDPKLFRRGSNERNIAEIEPYTAEFLKAQGAMMNRLGYNAL